jgi:bile acid:Na+ symporter, BASS family
MLLPLAAVAAALALVAPSGELAERSDLVLAALVLFTSLGIRPTQLLGLRRRAVAVVALVVVPFVVLPPLAWLVSLPFSGAVSNGVLALGVSSTEAAAVGLVAIAGGNAVLAAGALTGSLVLAALAGPVLLSALAGAGADIPAGELVGRFSVVVLVPLAVGLLMRAVVPALDRAEPELAGLATVTVVVLVYAAMSGAGEDGQLAEAAAASALFLVACAIAVAGWVMLAPRELRATGGLVIELRDFAVLPPWRARRSAQPLRQCPASTAC